MLKHNIPDDSCFAGYDLIGDIHGCADSLEALLTKLNYVKRSGVYEYSDVSRPRQLIFLGDILDRGAKIRESILLIRSMVERGSAQIIMGNHEFNALAYMTPVSDDSTGSQFLRSHSPLHNKSIRETLEQFANYPRDWKDTLEWIYDWPMFLEFEAFRVVHACWDQELIDEFLQLYPDACIDEVFLRSSSDYKQLAGKFMNRITRGVSLLLPEGASMTSQDGYTRRSFRVKYWVENPSSYSDIEFQPDALEPNLAALTIGEKEKQFIPFYSPQQRPLFIGHYWQQGVPAPIVSNIACLDYSAVKNGKLVAYRMNGEQQLKPNNFVWVDGEALSI